MPIALHSTRIPDSFVTKDRNKSIKKMLTYGKLDSCKRGKHQIVVFGYLIFLCQKII